MGNGQQASVKMQSRRCNAVLPDLKRDGATGLLERLRSGRVLTDTERPNRKRYGHDSAVLRRGRKKIPAHLIAARLYQASAVPPAGAAMARMKFPAVVEMQVPALGTCSERTYQCHQRNKAALWVNKPHG